MIGKKMSKLSTWGWMKELRESEPTNYNGIGGTLGLYLDASHMAKFEKTGKSREDVKSREGLIYLLDKAIRFGVPLGAMAGATVFGFYNGITGQSGFGNGHGLNARDIAELAGSIGAGGVLAIESLLERKNIEKNLTNATASLIALPVASAVYHGAGYIVGSIARDLII